MVDTATPTLEAENPTPNPRTLQQRTYYALNRAQINESNKARMRLKRAQPDGEVIEHTWADLSSLRTPTGSTPGRIYIPRDEGSNDDIDDNDNDSIDLPDLDPPGDLSEHLTWSHWPNWSAEQHLAAIRRWVMYTEPKYHSPLDRWAQSFDADFQYGVPLDDGATRKWRRGQAMVIAGQNAVGYLGRVMEGELPADDETLRDIYVQALQLSAILHRAVSGLQHRLDFVQKSWYK
ncbi:hypothetical protein FIBSPDRAFT_896487 [Athelia psychrophila]|uniref:Uncharacterized protein n=1 Tax=Athelia psychrophila TaxID=1759441 RepID=A0A166DE74_9AGAM|nr:hypothetical protein FIBSPDRAFT_896487 [Fibularhizoctonia sp. CBS 109695]